MLAQHLITDFPELYKNFAIKEYAFDNRAPANRHNRNPILGLGIGADGLKTGHTEEAGYGLTASAKRGERRLILVFNGLPTMRARAEESERLLEWGFREFENVTLFAAGDTVESAKVWLGAQPSVPLVGGRDLVLTLPRAWRRTASARRGRCRSTRWPGPSRAWRWRSTAW